MEAIWKFLTDIFVNIDNRKLTKKAKEELKPNH